MKIRFGTSLVVNGILVAASSTLALGQVAGDECTNAILAVDGVNAGYSTATATPSANAPQDETCTFLDWGQSQDLWFRYPAAGAGSLTLDFCASGYDTSIVVYRGTCAALTRIACDDDSCAGGTYRSYKAGIAIPAAGDVFIRVGGWNADSGAVAFTLTFDPASASCAGATGGCGTAHGGIGCNDPICCTAVCNVNPLCCDLGWDASCVQAAIGACGIFVYSCNPGTPTNDCASNAQVVAASGSFPFSTVGANTDGPNHLGSLCANSGSQLLDNDVWWRVQAPVGGVMQLSTCNAVTYDNKLAVYSMGTNPATFDFNTLPSALVACNDDGASGTCNITGTTTMWASALDVSVTAGNWYLIRNGSYAATAEGTGTITITLPTACSFPSGTIAEAEACGSNSNGGCGPAGTASEPISIGQKVSGTFSANAGTRDTDWYSFTVASSTTVSLNYYANTLSKAFVVTGDCASVVSSAGFGCPANNGPGICLLPGNYFVAVVPDGFEGLPCGSGALNQYAFELMGAPATCPPSSDTCDNAGPNTSTQSNSPTITVGGVACGLGGVTGANTYARSFTGLTSGEIRCVEFGYSNSGAPVPVSLIVCQDTNGGAPVSIGTDLVELARRDLVPFQGFGTVTAKFDTPICLDGNTSPIVVVIQIGASTNGFAVYAGNELGATAPTYIGLTAALECGTPTVFTDVAGIGFGNLQWMVNINGDYAQCSTNNCPADIDGDGIVSSADLSILLGGWGGSSPDLDGDGVVGSADLSVLLSAWGVCP